MDVSPVDSGARLSSDATSNNSDSQPFPSSSTGSATANAIHLIESLGLEYKERDPVVYRIEKPLNLETSLLRDPLKNKHKNECDFNKSLFAKSREMVLEALKRLGYPEPLHNDDSQLVCSFKVEDNVHDVFFGLSREATDTKTNLKPDHAVVLFRKKAIKDENTQKIVDFVFEVFRFLAVVELEFLNKDHSPAELTRDIKNNKIEEPLLRNKHHCLAHAISYIFRLVWPGLCGCGYSGTEVPFAVIVGKKEGIDINPHLRCAHGSVVMSQECCGGPEYHIDDSISFLLEKKKKGPEEQPPKKTKIEIKQEEVTVDLIAGVYSDIVSFGMNVALKVPQTRIDKPMGYPLSGRKLTIDGEDLYPEGPLTLIASPVSSRGGHGLKVAQGDLFEGFLSEELLKKLTVDGVDGVWLRQPPEGGCKVIVKVSSVIHQPTVERKSFYVLQSVMYRGSDSLKGSLAEVLLVVQNVDFGIITVMRDLRGDDEYQVLRPKALISRGYPFVTLWGGVENLVDSVLLPITQKPMNAVHCDIRPGYDHTSNILVKEDWGNLKLVLIDHESFAGYPADVPKFLNSDGRYVHSAYAANAVEYLWWQCVLLAYVWSGRLNEYVPEEVNKKAASQIIKNCLGLGETGAVATNKFEEWLLKNETMLDHLRLRQKRADPKELHNMLKAISGFFEEYH